MNNLFKKGFASLALASAMTSSIFAGNAAYIDIKVNYLGGKGVAVLGYDETDAKKNDNRDKVELLVSILDKDGAYATKNDEGKELKAISIEGNLSNTGGSINGKITETKRSLVSNDNVQRIILDYTLAVAKSNLENEITIKSGKLERKQIIKLASVDAKGLIVRATPNGKIAQEDFVNANFKDINASGEAQMLSLESSKAPGGIVGLMIPIQVYASNYANNVSVDGNFTLAPNLDGKTIVIQALGDYADSATGPETVLNSIELTMTNGQASGEIKITHGMPGDGHGIVITPASNLLYETALSDGLGIAFVAYVKDEQSINNYSADIKDDTKLDKFKFDKSLVYWGGGATTAFSSNTDTIQVKSGEPKSLKVGTLDRDAKTADKLWTKTSSVLTLSEGTGITAARDGNISDVNDSHRKAVKVLTVVDMYGNSAMTTQAGGAITATVKFGSKTTSKLVTENTVVALAAAGGFDKTQSTVTVTVTDSEDINNTKKIKSVGFTVDASNGMLSSVDSVDLTARTLPLITYTVGGGSSWKNSISDVSTTDLFKVRGNVPLIDFKDVVKADTNGFTIVLKSGLGDKNVTDQNSTFRLFIVDNTGKNTYLEKGDLEKYQVAMIGIGAVTVGTTTTILPFGGTTAYVTGHRTGETSDDAGYYRFDYNSTNTTSTSSNATPVDFNLTFAKATTGKVFATIEVKGYNAKDNEDEATIHIPVYEDKKTNAYVSAYMSEDIDKDEAFPGTIINFKFTGTAVSTGDTVVIDMNTSGVKLVKLADGNFTSKGRIGLVGSDISINDDGIVTTTLPENGIVSIELYDVNKTGTTIYMFNDQDGNASRAAVTINGMKPVWMNLADDDDTKEIIELDINATFKMAKSEGGEAVAIVKAALSTHDAEDADGSSDKNRKKSPATAGISKDPITTKTKVLTGLYYGLFVANTDVDLQDKYGNAVDDVDNELGDIELSATDGIEFNDDGVESWIKFKESAVGTKQTLTISFVKDDKTKVSNTITWSNIALSKDNTGFNITDNFGGFKDPNTGIFDVVNSEIVIKIVGNGGKKQSGTTIKLSHTDKDATVRLVKIVDLSTNLYDNVLSGLDDSIKTGIKAEGEYFIVSANKPGDLTITVSSVNKDKKDKEIPISSTHKITFDAIDLDKPMVLDSGVVAANGTITIEITDKNLDTVKTLVTVSDINDHGVIKAVYTDGKYVAQVGNAGIYQVEVLGVDMADNRQRFNFTRKMGEGGSTLEDSLVAHGSYVVDGMFSRHDFKDIDGAFDWVYTQGETMYQLNAKDSKDVSAFKWGEVTDIKVEDKNPWYMVKLTGTAGTADAKGKYGWVLVDKAGRTFKLSNANDNGTFMFSKALYVKGTITGSNVSFAKR